MIFQVILALTTTLGVLIVFALIFTARMMHAVDGFCESIQESLGVRPEQRSIPPRQIKSLRPIRT